MGAAGVRSQTSGQLPTPSLSLDGDCEAAPGQQRLSLRPGMRLPGSAWVPEDAIRWLLGLLGLCHDRMMNVPEGPVVRAEVGAVRKVGY